MSDSWLVKFASRQPPVEAQFRQQIDAMSFDELRDFVGPSPTTTIDSFMDKAASAIQQGRELAHEKGAELFEKSAFEAQIDQALADSVANLSDEAAIKLAEMLESGTDLEKIAGIMGMAGGALKTLGGMAVKHPTMAAGLGGAALGAAAGGPGNRMGGALAGGALGAGAAHLSPGISNTVRKGGFAAGLKGQQMMGMGKVGEEVRSLYKVAMAKCLDGGSGEGSWLTQFEGSPLLPQAIELAQHEVQMEIEGIQKRQERQAMLKNDGFEEEWTKRDIISAQKHLLELQLIAQRNGLGAQPDQGQAPPQQEPQAAQQPQGASAPPQQQQQGVGGPGGVQMPMGQEKQAGLAGQVLKTMGAHPAATGAVAGTALGAAGGEKGHRLGAATALGTLGAGVGAVHGLPSSNWAKSTVMNASKAVGRSAPKVESQMGKAIKNSVGAEEDAWNWSRPSIKYKNAARIASLPFPPRR